MPKKAKRKKSAKSAASPKQPEMQDLRAFVRAQGTTFLEDANVTSIGIGFKDDGGVPTDQLCVQFTVREKADGVALEALDTEPIPETVRVGDFDVPTDVIQRDYEASYELRGEERSQAPSRGSHAGDQRQPPRRDGRHPWGHCF